MYRGYNPGYYPLTKYPEPLSSPSISPPLACLVLEQEKNPVVDF